MKEKISIRLFFWDMKPKIVLCDDAKVSKFNLSQVISFWNRAGYGSFNRDYRKECNLITYSAKFVSRAKGIWIYKILWVYRTKNVRRDSFCSHDKIEDVSSNSLKCDHGLGHHWEFNIHISTNIAILCIHI